MRQRIPLTVWNAKGERGQQRVIADVDQGLAIHPPHDTAPDALEHIWILTHVLSGDRVCVVSSRRVAQTVRERLLERLDWTVTADQVRETITRRQVARIVEVAELEHGGPNWITEGH